MPNRSTASAAEASPDPEDDVVPPARWECDHPDCQEVVRRLAWIQAHRPYEDYVRALATLPYCTPRHWDDADGDPEMPRDAGPWLDAETMPATTARWRARWQGSGSSAPPPHG